MDGIETLSDIYKALGDPTRLRLLKLLTDQTLVFCGGACDGSNFLCVGALAQKLTITQSAVSQHLRILRQAGLVQSERRGAFMHYSISPQGLEQFRKLVNQTMGQRFSSG
jgi:DNA-binding transcriptional ArsR family regulator